MGAGVMSVGTGVGTRSSSWGDDHGGGHIESFFEFFEVTQGESVPPDQYLCTRKSSPLSSVTHRKRPLRRIPWG